jgi:acyl dehydratase
LKEASPDNMRRFGDGVDDYNPLWRDEEHAASSHFGMVTAPQIFMYGINIGVGASINGAIDGRRLSSANFPMNYAGGEIEFYKTIWLDDKIRTIEEVGPVIRKEVAELVLFTSVPESLATSTNDMNLSLAKTP